jgi:hypothetical protein
MKTINRDDITGRQERPPKHLFSVWLPLLCIVILMTAVGASAEDLVCTDCHYSPHGSACGTCSLTCHSNMLSNIKHPIGPGTPLADLFTDEGKTAACVTCHVGPDMVHPFRINTDPTMVLLGYADLDFACGQCHGGGTDESPGETKNGAMWFSKVYVQYLAEGMHAGSNLPPVPGYANAAQTSGTKEFCFDDTSHDGEPALPQSGLTITIDWGDGSGYATAHGGDQNICHTYAGYGGFMIVRTITDPAGATVGDTIPAQISPPEGAGCVVTVKVVCSDGSTPIPTATVYLKQAGAVVGIGFTKADGTWTFPSRPSAPAYTVAAYKSTVDFSSASGMQSTSADAAASCSATTTIKAVSP